MEHDARPSVTINLVAQFNEFLKDQAEKGGCVENLQKLKADAGITLTLTSLDDPDSVGTYVQWRCGWYVAGGMDSLLNFFMLFDEYMAFKTKQFARATVDALN